MTLFPAIQAFLAYPSAKYISPDKAGIFEQMMLDFKEMGQEARKEFEGLAKDFQQHHPQFSLQRTSNWLSQAQMIRPHFWVYFQEGEEVGEPTYALRLYGDEREFGVSLEVSFIERKKEEDSLDKQNQVLTVPSCQGIYYVAQDSKHSKIYAATEENRQLLAQEVKKGHVRKVLVRKDICLTTVENYQEILAQLDHAMETLKPYYQATQK